MKTIKTPITYSELLNLHNAIIPKFSTAWESGEINERYKRAENWSEKEKADIKKQGRQALSFGLIPTKVNQFLAEQRKNRTEWKVVATQDPNDEIKAELATIQIRECAKRNNFPYMESDIFDSGLSVKYGVAKICVEKDRYYNDVVVIKDIDYRNFVWDINSTEYEKGDAKFMAEINKMYRDEVYKKYGINERTETLATGQDIQDFGREKLNYYIRFSKNNLGFKDDLMDLISVFTHYQKTVRTYHCVVFNDTAGFYGEPGRIISEKYRTAAKAKVRLRELQSQYLIKLGQDPGGEVIKEEKDCYDKYVFTYQGILEYEETDLEFFPYSVYTSFYFKNEFWCLSDILKDPQIFIDRLYNQIDYAFGKDIKNQYEIVVNQLADGETPETVMQKIEDGKPILVKAPNSINAVKSQGANPQWMLMAQTMQQLLEDMSGGRSFQGLKESSGESGRAIALKQLQGQMIATLFQDNLFRWKKDLGHKILKMLAKVDTAERIIRIAGGELTPEMLEVLNREGLYKPSLQNQEEGYVVVNKDGRGLAFLEDESFELTVSQEVMTDTERDRRLQLMMLAEQQNPIIAGLSSWVEMKLQYMDIPQYQRMRLLQELRAQQQVQQQMQQEQLGVEKAKVLAQIAPKEEKIVG